MTFQNLVGLKTTEKDLLDKICSHLKSEFDLHKNKFFFIKLSNCGNNTVEVAWAKEFTDGYKFGDLLWGSEYRQASIITRFENNHHVIFCCSFYLSSTVYVYESQIKEKYAYEGYEDIESEKMPTEEQLRGFDDIVSELKTAKTTKAV